MEEKRREWTFLIVNQQYHDVNPLICGWESCERGHSFGPASRECYLLHYVFSGKGCFYSGGREYRVGKGQMFVIRPYEITTYTADREEPWQYGWVGFGSALPLGELLGQDVITLPGGAHIFRSFQECESLQSGRELYLCGKIYELLALLQEKQARPEGGIPQFVLQAKTYIESNYVQPIEVGRLAGDLNLDRSHFSTVFRQYMGKSPQQYIVDFRMMKAAELLTAHGYRPGEAGQSVGYGDIFQFSRMFKKKYGVSPKEYAQRAEKK